MFLHTAKFISFGCTSSGKKAVPNFSRNIYIALYNVLIAIPFSNVQDFQFFYILVALVLLSLFDNIILTVVR